MSRADRMRLIEEIEAQRGSRLIAAIWGDRQNHATVIASDAHPVFFEHLQKFGKVRKVDVLLYSTGGHTLAAWGLANLLREYCDELGVLVPHRAYSAATLLSLAANEIVMSRNGQLSPIDPSIASPLGPAIQSPAQPGIRQVVPISVEDVVGFLELAKNQAGLQAEQSILQIFDRLSTQVHPLALGAVHRSREQIQMLAQRLLSSHMIGNEKQQRVEKIVNTLTRELGSHDYPIGRKEAKERLELNVVDVSPTLEQKILLLFEEYSHLLELRIPYLPEGFLQQQNTTVAVGSFNRAIIESKDLSHVFRTTKEIRRVQIQQTGSPIPVSGVQETSFFEGWVNDQTV